MSSKKECIVVIPVYKSLVENDRVSITQALKMTIGIDVAFIMPESFSIDDSFKDYKHIHIERFDDIYFANILGYNKLMLEVSFYKRFIDYKYVLIHQTDAFIFRPNLQHWCDKGYDYIGAPWLYPNKLRKIKYHPFLLNKYSWIYSHRRQREVMHYNNVGNGGLSLRKIESFISILESKKTKNILDVYFEKQKEGDHIYNEDMFWAIEVPMLHNNFKKQAWYEAIYFAIENCPTFAYNHMNKQLPFGCHAPLIHEFEFWKDHIPITKP